MQFAFSYFYFLMSEKKVFDVVDMFQKIDTDNSGLVVSSLIWVGFH